MAVRGWTWSIATAVGAAACAGAAQLGVGYGLGIIAWRPATDAASESVWLTSLIWTTWVAASATVAGAVYANRHSGRDRHGERDRPDGTVAARPIGSPASAAGTPADAATEGPARTAAGGHPAGPPVATGVWRLALAIAAAFGAAVTVLLVAVPAQAALRADTFSPQTIAGGYAVLGIILGLLVAVWACASPPVAANVTATGGWLWLIAVLAVGDRVVSGSGGTGGLQLGVWRMTPDADRFSFGAIHGPGAALTLAAALVIGVLTALPAARRGDSRIGVAVSGALGPIMVAVAYFLAAPRLAGVRGDQASAHLVAPYAVIAGLAGSVLVAAIGQRTRRPRRTGAPAAVPVRDEPAGPVAGSPPPDAGTANRGHPAEPARGGAASEPDPDRGVSAPGQPAAAGDAGQLGPVRGQAPVVAAPVSQAPTGEGITLSKAKRPRGRSAASP